MNTRRRSYAVSLTTALILIFLSTAVWVPARASGLVNRGAASNPIRIGEIDALTGPDAPGSGLYERMGAELALRQINAHGGIHGRPVILPALAVNQLVSLLTLLLGRSRVDIMRSRDADYPGHQHSR